MVGKKSSPESEVSDLADRCLQVNVYVQNVSPLPQKDAMDANRADSPRCSFSRANVDPNRRVLACRDNKSLLYIHAFHSPKPEPASVS